MVKIYNPVFYNQNVLSFINVPKINFNVERLELSSTMAKIQSQSHDQIFSEHIEPDLENANKIMLDNGWWFLLSLPTSIFIQLNKIESKVTPENLTNWIVNYFNEDDCKELKKLVREWELEPFCGNKEVYNAALWAHEKGKYVLTVPTLTIEVEGILRRYFDFISAKSVHEYKNQLKKECEDTIDKNEYGGMIKFVRLKNLEFVEKSLNKFYESFDERNPRNFDDIYRHPLVHGQYLEYGSLELSTKLFLFLDMMHCIIEDLERLS